MPGQRNVAVIVLLIMCSTQRSTVFFNFHCPLPYVRSLPVHSDTKSKSFNLRTGISERHNSQAYLSIAQPIESHRYQLVMLEWCCHVGSTRAPCSTCPMFKSGHPLLEPNFLLFLLCLSKSVPNHYLLIIVSFDTMQTELQIMSLNTQQIIIFS